MAKPTGPENPRLMVEGWIPPKLEREFTVVGKPLNRIDALEKVTGKARYAGDIKFPNLLHAKILRSPHPHARIRAIDTSEAEALAGVHAILTKDNTSGWLTHWYEIPQVAFPETVSYVGHEVAAVAAESIDVATKALDLIQVDYELLPSVFDAEEALKPGAPEVTVSDLASDSFLASRPPKLGNLWGGKPDVHVKGDVDRGFREADFIFEGRYKTPFQCHGTLQTRSCVATLEGDVLTVYESCQGVWSVRNDLSKSLGLPPEKIRVVVNYQGGGFGSKAGAHRSITFAAWLALRTRRPVKLELTRSEEFVSHPRRPSTTIYIKTGVKKDGTLTAIRSKSIINIGSGGLYGPFNHDINQHPVLLYSCPNMHLQQLAVHTNLQFTGPARSPLNVAGVSAFEAHMDEIAEAIGIDPLAFRFKNYTVYADTVRRTPFSAKNLDKAMSQVAQSIGWERRAKRAGMTTTAQQPEGPKRRGIGMAIYVFHGVGLPPFNANASVVLRRGGRPQLLAGVVDIGSGAATVLSMIAAEELGVSLEDVEVVYGDTHPTTYSPATHASRVIPEMGPAVLQAAAMARERLFERVAGHWKVDARSLQSANGWIYSKCDSDADAKARRISFGDACMLLPEGESIVATGSRRPNVGTAPYNLFVRQADVTHATFGATAVEVEVNVETGEIRVLKSATAHEFGRALNPKLCNSQHYGGLVFGIGFALLEEPILDKQTGMTLNTDLHQYRMPTSLDMPEETIPLNIEGDDAYFAYSSKGGGEGINSAVPAAIRNAVYNAIGVPLNEYPMTPERVMEAIKASKKKKEEAVRQLNHA